MVVFASIVNEGYVNMGSERLHCIFNKNTDACNYGVFVGLVGLLACSFFFLLDYKFSSISSVKDRKKAVMLEIGFSGEDVTCDGRSCSQTQANREGTGHFFQAVLVCLSYGSYRK